MVDEKVLKSQDNDFRSQGLSDEEALKRQESYGANTIEKEKQIRAISILFSQFKSPLIYILVIAAVITVILGDLIDTGVISLAVIVNTILGFYQEYKAQQALAALRSLLSPKAVVLRGGERKTIDASGVVPGDICFVGLGERIPADGVVIEADDFSVTEAILSGESVPVHKKIFKDASNFLADTKRLLDNWEKFESSEKVFAGTTISSGQATVLVLATGSLSEVGKIAKSIQETHEEPTPLQKNIGRLSNQLAVLVGVIALVIFITGLLVGESFLIVFTTSVAVAVAAIPEGLAVSLTVILAIGMQRILKRRALVRKLVSAETLGSVTVICADKTGTLTEGIMKVTKSEFIEEEKGVEAVVLTSDQRDSLEIAMWDWVRETKQQDPQRIANSHERLDSIPFSPDDKFSAKLYKEGVYVIGAPEVVLSFCKINDSDKQEWLKKFDEYGLQGLRIVGFAHRQRKDDEKVLSKKSVKEGLEWLGVLIYEDPVRGGVAEAMAEAKKAGILVKVITGDFRATAEGVLERLGLLTHETKLAATHSLIIEGSELDQMTQEELKKRVKDTVLFSRIDPVQKLKIVEALQANGEVVAMTGDGVNDAPALKRADIGVVVSGATDVAKETADMVLLDDNFATIIAAVEEGRGIFANLRKVILYLLSDSFSEVILVLGSLIFGIPLPLSAAQILWINLITDGFPQLALTVEPKDPDLMKEKPREAKAPLVDLEIKLLIFLISLVTGLFTLGAFLFFWKNFGESVETARTVAFAMLGVDSLIYVFSARSLRRPIWQTEFFGNKWLIIAVLAGFSLQLAALYLPFLQQFLATRPLMAIEWLVVFIQVILVIGIIELVKWFFLKKKRLAMTT